MQKLVKLRRITENLLKIVLFLAKTLELTADFERACGVHVMNDDTRVLL